MDGIANDNLVSEKQRFTKPIKNDVFDEIGCFPDVCCIKLQYQQLIVLEGYD